MSYHQSIATMVKKKARSTTGSTQRPNSLRASNWRAMRPSITSERPAARMMTAVVHDGPGTSRPYTTTMTGRAARRASVRKFGM